ncbi:MAG TPA: RagB/SusD family nutrient uptake outer membrane protein [Longimicrobiaceae bacterium]|nr:RagB/SusD family nutrient uptake outer membrane protein [Longimicrobiaceae bacterium]
MIETNRRAVRSLAGVLGLATVITACQGSIVDLGTVENEELDRPEALAPLVAGMGRTLSAAVGLLAQTGMIASREMVYGGLGDDFGFTFAQVAGELNPVDSDRHWNTSQQARWTAEDGVRRMRQVLGDEEFARSRLAAEALLHVGFANRLLGENMCEGLVDGGPPGPRTIHFQRAEDAFTEALEIANRIGESQLAEAARAGRASSRVGLGDWGGARSDAETVPAGFAFRARYSTMELAQYNRVFWGSTAANRAHTVWSTFYEGYYEETGDPRVPWKTDLANPEMRNGLPWYAQAKYEGRDAPIDLVSWEEMRLIVAEARLREGDVEGAIAAIDALRVAAGVDPWPIDGLEGAWTALKRERGIELWLEGRRLWDLHRWLQEGTPGEAEDMTGRDTCVPIGAIERGTNPNIP